MKGGRGEGGGWGLLAGSLPPNSRSVCSGSLLLLHVEHSYNKLTREGGERGTEGEEGARWGGAICQCKAG